MINCYNCGKSPEIGKLRHWSLFKRPNGVFIFCPECTFKGILLMPKWKHPMTYNDRR